MTDINEKITDNLNSRLSALDKNLKNSFFSVKKDILNLRKGYDLQIKSIVSDLSALNQIAANIKGEAARQEKLSAVEQKVAKLEEQEKAIAELEARLSVEEEEVERLLDSKDVSSLKKKVDMLAADSASKNELSAESEYLSGIISKLERKLEDAKKSAKARESNLATKDSFQRLRRGFLRLNLTRKQKFSQEKYLKLKEGFQTKARSLSKAMSSQAKSHQSQKGWTGCHQCHPLKKYRKS
jgi:predicted RNase H-like nuclease (RuvC/YqgF family)